MSLYLSSLAAGMLAGVLYALLGVRSPAPPAVALIGLLGILLGEQIVPIALHTLDGRSVWTAWRRIGCAAHVFGTLPVRKSEPEAQPQAAPPHTPT